jgi:hypothetical protein
MIGFIDTLHTQLATTFNYSAIVISTFTVTLVSSVYLSLHYPFPVHGFITFSLQPQHRIYFAQHNSYLAIILPTANSWSSFSSIYSFLRSSLYSLEAAPTENTGPNRPNALPFLTARVLFRPGSVTKLYMNFPSIRAACSAYHIILDRITRVPLVKYTNCEPAR